MQAMISSSSRGRMTIDDSREVGDNARLSRNDRAIHIRRRAHVPVDTPRWCGDGGEHLNLTPGAGLARDEIARERHACGATRPRSGSTRAAPSPWAKAGRRSSPAIGRARRTLFKLEFMMPTGSFKDRGMTVLVSYLKSRGVESRARRLVGQRGRVALGVCGGGRHALPDPRPRNGLVPEDRADRRVRRGRRDDARIAPGRRRRGDAHEPRDFLREPQLGAVLRRRHEDARVRAMGAARIRSA